MERALKPGDPIGVDLGDIHLVYGAMSFDEFRQFQRELVADIDDEEANATRWHALATRHLKSAKQRDSVIEPLKIGGVLGVDEIPMLAIAFRNAHFVSHDDRKKSESQPTSGPESSAQTA